MTDASNNTEAASEQGNCSGPTVCQPSITADVTDSINYAAWQNSVPLVRSLQIENPTFDNLVNLLLELTTSPPFARAKRWAIHQIGAGQKISLHDRDVTINPDYLNGLDEAERGVVQLRLLQGDRLLTETSHDIRVLARDEWGGMQSMGELLAAFVTPNDPALAKVLKLAASLLTKHDHSPALDGYQSGDPRRSYMLTAAIWSAVASKSLTYANPPGSFEQVGQKTRRVATVLSDGLATCLDSTLLFASAIEAVGLNPVIVMQDGHCFVGVWLVEKTMSRLIEPDCSEVRKAIAARELVTFETTLVTHRPPGRFEDAVNTATAATRESKEGSFVAAIDIARARMSQIRPLASHESRPTAREASVDASVPLALPDAPHFDSVAVEEGEETPATSDARIDRWQRKLLDLSLRNRLLNFKASKQVVSIFCPDIPKLEDLLASGKRLRMISLSDHNPVGDRDTAIHRQKTHQDLDVEFANQALDRNELACPLDNKDLNARLTTLYRKARNDLAEGGTNTLYLAVGFLKWKQKPEDSKSYRAPILLVPVKIVRSSAVSPFQLAHHEDDVRFNATLIQLLKKDFGRDISHFESNLPADESGVDVPRVLEQMRREVRDIPGFEVVDESAIATFSFAKYLMWKDLVGRIDQLADNRVVRHLIQDPDKPFSPGVPGAIPDPHEIDVRYTPDEIVHPLPADSSQLAAVMAASEGHDFVLVGPPGTGKSQTIANIICQCLATGKTALFVAEKTAALDVVYRRLRAQGLGDCCLELHSNKAERRKFLDQLDASWRSNSCPREVDWITVSDRLRVRRDELNSYAAAIHTRHSNGWTAYQALGISVQGRALTAPPLDWADTVQHDVAAFENLSGVIANLALTYESIEPDATLQKVCATQWSAAWEMSLLQQCDQLNAAATSLQRVITKFTSAMSLKGTHDCSLEELNRLNRFAQVLLKCGNEDVTILFHKQFAKFPAAMVQLKDAIAIYRKWHESAAAIYSDETIYTIPVDELAQSWREGAASMWPFSWFAKRRVTRLLQSYAAEGTANPSIDLAAIRGMRDKLVEITANPLAGQTAHWKKLHTDTQSLNAHLQLANEVRQAIVGVGQPLQATNEIAKAIFPALKAKSEQLPIFGLASDYLKCSTQFLSACREFAKQAGGEPVDAQSSEIVADTKSLANYIQAHRTQLKQWTAWCDVKKRAQAVGLAPFVDALEAGRIKPSELSERFKLAYARWWLPKVIDRVDVLRVFQRFKHEDAIADFRKLDDLARSTASPRAQQAIAHELPPADKVPRKSELGLLRHQVGLKRPSKSIREVISGMPETFGQLAPCLLMSPLSIAQYLPADQTLFDVVIFDEASQITTWDAIGAIARGRQTIIVGDPKQLPPTNFFGRADDDEYNDELDDHEKDLESILDEAQAAGLPTLQLNWHYRSRHESLIAFSNWNYYGNKLVTFPAADSEGRGVSLHFLAESVYDRGKSRTNRKEADAIVHDAIARMKQCLAKPESERLTYGVITFNIQQQTLIQDLLDQAQRDDPELEWFFSDDRIEPTAVKNLENVQGDERDVMFFSITFGFDIAGKFPINFGAVNRDGGERRLNVAVTRARRELAIYASFKAEQLRAERSQAKGIHDLKNFLEYAEKGSAALAARTGGSVDVFDSPFEEAVSEALSARGWQVEPQIGVSGFRVDLGIIHPDKPGAYLAGVECDGATYHRSAIARDRDKTRQQVLENLGWNILRVWSPDWWYDADSAIERVHESLKQLLDAYRAQLVPTDPAEIEPPAATLLASKGGDTATTEQLVAPAGAEAQHDRQYTSLIKQQALAESKAYYQRVKLLDATACQERFFDDSYTAELRSMALAVLEQESPIREDVLARQIARAHGFARTGGKLRQRILDLVKEAATTDESTGRFLWSFDGPRSPITFRYSHSEEDQRSVDEIAIAEILGLINTERHLLDEADPAIAYARKIGLARLSQSARERLEEAIALFKMSGGAIIRPVRGALKSAI